MQGLEVLLPARRWAPRAVEEAHKDEKPYACTASAGTALEAGTSPVRLLFHSESVNILHSYDI